MSENRYLSGNFAPVEEELTALDLPVTGTIPPELSGRFVRIGPNPVDADPANYHWFTGTGMVHGVRLSDGKAEWYRNRYVRDDDVVRVKGGPPVPGPVGEFGGFLERDQRDLVHGCQFLQISQNLGLSQGFEQAIVAEVKDPHALRCSLRSAMSRESASGPNHCSDIRAFSNQVEAYYEFFR